jgi:hypothetical protein
MAKKTTTTTKPAVQVKKDAKGRLWLVATEGGEERGPFDTKKQALEAKAGEPAPKPVKATKARKTTETKEKKLSAIDAAAQVLATATGPMNSKEMIEAMAAQRLWTSPGGKTPHATLYTVVT